MRVGLIGTAGHYHSALQVIEKRDDLTLVGVMPGDTDEDAASYARFGCPVFTDEDELMEQTDILIVNPPFYRTSSLAVKALKRGIHVYSEKPAATSLKQLDELEQALAASPAAYLNMFTYYYDPIFVKAAQLVRGGAIGRVRLISSQKSYKLGTRAAFYGDKARYGGSLPWVGIHAAQWMRMLTGLDFLSVTATCNREDNFGNRDLDIADTCLLQLSQGVSATMTVEFLRPQSAATHGDDRIRVVGQDGIVEILHEKLFLLDKDGEREIDCPPLQEDIFEGFLRYVQGETLDFGFDAQEGLRITRAMLYAQRSAEEGKTFFIQ